MLILGQVGPATLVGASEALVGDGHGNLSQRKHVAVGIVARTGVFAPFICLVEYGVHGAPVIPQVVHHAPHVGVVKALLGILILCFARREGEHDGAACLIDGMTYHVYLVGVERTTEVVDFQEVDTPLGIEVHDAVVV